MHVLVPALIFSLQALRRCVGLQALQVARQQQDPQQPQLAGSRVMLLVMAHAEIAVKARAVRILV
jgi:hypothetical protein